MPFTAYHFNPAGELRCQLNEEETRAAFASREGLLWVDFSGPTEEDGKFLEQVFGFHHLSVEDCISPRIHPPKIDDFGDHLFIIVHGIDHTSETDIVETAEMAIFIGQQFVVSAHNFALYSVDHVRQQVEIDGQPMRRGADFLAHALLDSLIDNVLPTIDKMSEVADDIEEETIQNPHQTTLDSIMKIKRSTMRIHRVMAPQREILNRLSKREFPVVRSESQIFYRDVYDHMVRIEDLNQMLRDRADNALSIYLSSVSARQNETMRVLSIVATVFMPLTLLAGIYGMNFENMPELKWPWAYFAVLGLMGAVIAAVIWHFWARGWIAWGRSRVLRVRPFAVEPEKLAGYLSRLKKRPRLPDEKGPSCASGV